MTIKLNSKEELHNKRQMGNVTKFQKHSTLHFKILVDYIWHILIMSEDISYEENRFENQE
jgi:hypothetical protein